MKNLSMLTGIMSSRNVDLMGQYNGNNVTQEQFFRKAYRVSSKVNRWLWLSLGVCAALLVLVMAVSPARWREMGAFWAAFARYATWVALVGLPIFLIAKLFAHSSVKTLKPLIFRLDVAEKERRYREEKYGA